MSPTTPGPIGFSMRSPSRSQKTVAAEVLQLWKLKVNADHTAVLICEDGDGKPVYSKAIEFTNFPLPEIAFYFTDNVILLPGEY
jgi:hypothetical protein